MRQFLSPRFWLTLAVLAGLALGLAATFGRSDALHGTPLADPVPVVGIHRVDLVAPVAVATPAPGFELVDGRTTAPLALQLDAARTMVITRGTPGEMSCPEFPAASRCVVAADLLGDAVLWFSIVPGTPGATVQLPAVSVLLDGGWVRLDNGWEVRRATRVERTCDDDTSSLTDFIRTFGGSATSTFNFEAQRLVRVTCPRAGTTTTTLAGGSALVPGETIVASDDEIDTVPPASGP